MIFGLALVLFASIFLGRNNGHSTQNNSPAAGLEPLKANTEGPPSTSIGLLPSDTSPLDNATPPTTDAAAAKKNLTSLLSSSMVAHSGDQEVDSPRLEGSLIGSLTDPSSISIPSSYPTSAPSGKKRRIDASLSVLSAVFLLRLY